MTAYEIFIFVGATGGWMFFIFMSWLMYCTVIEKDVQEYDEKGNPK